MESITIIIVLVTGVVSYIAWQRPELFQKLLLWPYNVVRQKQYYRMLTHGFIHADWGHLIINMFVFWSFGRSLIQYFNWVWGAAGAFLFVLLYLSAIVVSSVYSVLKHKNNYAYTAVGASGATSAVIFACMFFDPWNMIYFFGIIPIPGILFGIVYLIYSYWMGKRGGDNIGHDAHFWGAVYGFVFPLICKPALFKLFIQQLSNFPL